jgi:predicted PurR-regulated permease PerM
MACIGILVTIVLSILGIPSAFAIGMIAGIGEFIPYIGALISTIPAIMLALMEGPEMLLWVILAIVAVQQLQGNIIMPLVQQRMVSLPPAVTIFSFLIMGFLFGLPGILLAEPLTVFVYVMVKKLYIRDVLGEKTKIPGEKFRS